MPVTKRTNKIISTSLQLQIVDEYSNGTPLPELLQKYNISRVNLQYYRNKFNIPERFAKRAATLKSITLEHNGSIKTYPSVEAASIATKIPTDYLHKLRRAENFCEGKNSREQVTLIHDLLRLQDLELACELMGKILSQGTVTDKFQWGNDLKTLLYKLGYSKEEEIELLNTK